MATPVITHHALRCFAERALGVQGLPADDHEALKVLASRGFDLNDLSRTLSAFLSRAVSLGAVAVTLDGSRYILRGRVLTTVVPASRPRPRARRARIERDDD